MTSILPARSTLAAATQPVGYRGTQKIYLELDADHVMVQPDRAAGRAAGRMVRHGGHHAGMNQAVLLPVTLGGNQSGFAIFVFDADQLHTQIANKVGAVEDVADLIFQQFIHRILWGGLVRRLSFASNQSRRRECRPNNTRKPSAAGLHPR